MSDDQETYIGLEDVPAYVERLERRIAELEAMACRARSELDYVVAFGLHSPAIDDKHIRAAIAALDTKEKS